MAKVNRSEGEHNYTQMPQGKTHDLTKYAQSVLSGIGKQTAPKRKIKASTTAPSMAQTVKQALTPAPKRPKS